MIDILKPKKSKLESGLKGKTIIIYGSNRTGKSSNLTKAEKPLFLAFEYGLEASNDVSYFNILKWRDFQDTVDQLTGTAHQEEIRAMYQTIVIDTADAMCRLAAEYICNVYNITSIGEDSTGKKGWGRWTEYRAELSKQITKLTNAGYTVAFIAHDDTRKITNDKGEEYSKFYPKGDKAAMDFICDLCGIIGYACSSFKSEDGKENLSTLYLKDSLAYKAGSRYDFLVPSIPNWSWEKLDQALADAVAKQESRDKVKAVTTEKVVQEKKAEAEKEEEVKLPINVIINTIGDKLTKMNEKNGNINEYTDLLTNKLRFPADFRAQTATEKQREQLEQILDGLTKLGY